MAVTADAAGARVRLLTGDPADLRALTTDMARVTVVPIWREAGHVEAPPIPGATCGGMEFDQPRSRVPGALKLSPSPADVLIGPDSACNLGRVGLVGTGMTETDHDEFTAFVRERGDALLRYARLLVADPAEAEDALQTALLRLLRHWPKKLDAPEAYTRAAILNIVRDGFRRRHLVAVPTEARHDRPAADSHCDDALAAAERLGRLLAGLPPRQRATVVLRVIEGLSEAETAKALRCSAGTVKSNLARGLDKVRAALREEPSHDKEGALR